jgi:hypothetical protein
MIDLSHILPAERSKKSACNSLNINHLQCYLSGISLSIRYLAYYFSASYRSQAQHSNISSILFGVFISENARFAYACFLPFESENREENCGDFWRGERKNMQKAKNDSTF